MSQGQQRKVELARALSQPAHIYLWDEPLNYLDVFNQEQIIQMIKNSKPSMLVIEHDQYFVDQVADIQIELVKAAFSTLLFIWKNLEISWHVPFIPVY